MTAPIIRTERLWLRPFDRADTDDLHALFVLPEVRRYLLDDQVMPRAWVEEEIARSRETFEASGHGLWTLALEAQGDPIGAAGYRAFHEPPVTELLYLLDSAHWGRSLAFEASRAALRYGFETLGYDPIAASIDAPNQASIRLVERLGFEEAGRSPGDLHEQVHFTLARGAFDPELKGYELLPASGA